MQFSKNFMIGSVIVILLAFGLWNVGQAQGWFSDEPEAAEDGAANETVPDEDASEEDDSSVGRAMASVDRSRSKKETPIMVEAEPVVRGTLIKRVSAQGRVHGYKRIDVVSEVSGPIEAILFRDGDKVQAGDVIAKIDDREYRIAYEEAQANYLVAKADFVAFDESLKQAKLADQEMAGELGELTEAYRKGQISETDYRSRRLELELKAVRSGDLRDEIVTAKYLGQAMASLERAEMNLDRCTIRAPFSGVLFGLDVSPGGWIGANTKIAELVNMSDTVIKAQVLESEVGQIYVGRSAKVKFTALPDLGIVPAKVEAVSPLVNEEQKTVETIVSFQSNDSRIRPGMFAEVIIDSQMYEDRLMVPKRAILPRDDRKVVFRVGEDSRAKWIYVESGVENDQFVEITRGDLNPGDLVLTNNHYTMGHDTLVKIDK